MGLHLIGSAEQMAACKEQEKALKEGPKFLTEYMVYFDPEKAEGPYNDVYMYCYIKNRIITKDTKICEKGSNKIQRAGDCNDLQDFLNLVPSTDNNAIAQDNKESAPELALHRAWDKKLSKELIDKFIQNAELFDCEEESDIIDKEILENIFAQTEKEFNKEKGEIKFRVVDFEGYIKEDLSDEQQGALKELAKEVLRFMLHKKWDGTLPEEMIDLVTDVAELFEDPYEPERIDLKICRGTYVARRKSTQMDDIKERYKDIDRQVHKLEKLIVVDEYDDIELTPHQEEVLRQIATLQRDYICSNTESL